MFQVACKTDVGKKRTINQDALLVTEDLHLYLVADGMGGHQAGEIASQMTVDVVESYIRKHLEDVSPKELITTAITEANKQVYLKSFDGEEYRGMGTTCSLVLVKDGHVYLGHVGDSRIYFIYDDIKQVTTDHSLVEDLVAMGEISRDEAKTHPKRHVITRAVGTDATVQVDLLDFELGQIKKILICSDGLSEKLDDQEILNMVNAHNLNEAVDNLVQLANDRGGNDNITVVLLAVNEC